MKNSVLLLKCTKSRYEAEAFNKIKITIANKKNLRINKILKYVNVQQWNLLAFAQHKRNEYFQEHYKKILIMKHHLVGISYT